MCSVHKIHAFFLHLIKRVNAKEFSVADTKGDIKIDICLLCIDYIFESCPV